MSDFDMVRKALLPRDERGHSTTGTEGLLALAALDRLEAAYVEMEKATAYHYKIEDVLAENLRLREALEKIVRLSLVLALAALEGEPPVFPFADTGTAEALEEEED